MRSYFFSWTYHLILTIHSSGTQGRPFSISKGVGSHPRGSAVGPPSAKAVVPPAFGKAALSPGAEAAGAPLWPDPPPPPTGVPEPSTPAEGAEPHRRLRRWPSTSPQPGGVGLTNALDLFSAIMVNKLKVFI